MNRTGLVVALVIAAVVGVLFGLYPRFDLGISALFFDPQGHAFAFNKQAWVRHSRDAARWLVTLLAAPAGFALVGKLIAPRRAMVVRGRSAVFLLATLALGPGLLANGVFKEHWGRSRPADVVAFDGTHRFTAWWDPRGDCPSNCSFIAGEPSGAIWTLAPASLAPPQWRLLAYGAALAFGAAVGVLRIGAGGHFFTDVIFAGVFVFLVIWMTHGLMFRWRPTRAGDETFERPFAAVGEGVRRAAAALARRLGGQTREAP